VTSDGVLPVTHEIMRGFSLLAELRFADVPDGQAINSWDWQVEARRILAEHLERHGEAIAVWAAGAEQRRAVAAERGNEEYQAALERLNASTQEV
jgi:hypothetical protein